jgi:hypothetical protein
VLVGVLLKDWTSSPPPPRNKLFHLRHEELVERTTQKEQENNCTMLV